MQVINIATATFAEATATGGLDLLGDRDLRVDLAAYYYTASQLIVDERVDDHWRKLRSLFASRGLAAEGASSDEAIAESIRTDSNLVAEIVNARELALQQFRLSSSVLTVAIELARSIEETLE